jgi:mandelamide amidase
MGRGVAGAFDAAVSRLRQGGATVVDVDLGPVVSACFEIGFAIGFYEMNSAMRAFLAQYQPQTTLEAVVDEIASADVKGVYANAVIGEGAPTEAAYKEAIGRIGEIRRRYLEILDDHALDAILFPTAPLEAQPVDGSAETVILNGEAVPTLDTYIRNNASTGVYAAPALSIPIGTTAEGLPVGLELDGRPDTDPDLLSIGLGVEAALAAG